MPADRYVVLGLASARAEWFRDVTRWSTSAALPVELVRCVSVEDLRARLASGRPWSAVLVEDRLHVELDVDVPVLVVGRDLPADLDRDRLLDALAAHGRPVGTSAPHDDDLVVDLRDRRARLVAVLGTGGTGATTCAAALAQGLAKGGNVDVVLADLALHAEQGVLHDVRDVAPGIQELVDHHGDPRDLTFHVADRGYHLLLGLRSPRHWSALRPTGVERAVDALRRGFDIVVADLTGDLDGSTADLEERNVLARTATSQADLVLAVGRPTTKGVHSLVRLLGDLDRTRTVPVLVGAPKHPKPRAELAAVLSELAHTTYAPLFLPTRPVDHAWRDATPMPSPLPELLAGMVRSVRTATTATAAAPTLVRPGSLGVA